MSNLPHLTCLVNGRAEITTWFQAPVQPHKKLTTVHALCRIICEGNSVDRIINSGITWLRDSVEEIERRDLSPHNPYAHFFKTWSF